MAVAIVSASILAGAALVDTDGNAATNQTLLGDVDMGVGTLGDLKTYVSTGAVEEARNFTRTNAVLWHDASLSNIVSGAVGGTVGRSSLSFGGPNGNSSVGDYSAAFGSDNTVAGLSTAFGFGNTIGVYSAAFGDDNAVGEYSTTFGYYNIVDDFSTASGYYNAVGDYSAAFGYDNHVGPYSAAFGYENRSRYDDQGTDIILTMAFLMGFGNNTFAEGSFVMGAGNLPRRDAQLSFSFGTATEALHPGAFIWNFFPTNYFAIAPSDASALPKYQSHGAGSFNVNPIGGLDGFWIGETNLRDHVVNTIAPLALGMKSEVVSAIESGDIVSYRASRLRSGDGSMEYTATDLLEGSTNASGFAVGEFSRTNAVLANGPYVRQSVFGGDVKAIVTNAVQSWSDWSYSGDVASGTTYNIVSSRNGGGYSFRLHDFATDALLATAASLEEHPETLLFSVSGGTITATRTRAYLSDVTKVDGKVNAVSNWVENIDTSYFRTNVAVAASATRVVCPSNQNQTVQYINAPAGVSTIEITLPKDGMTKDWLVYILATDEISIVLPPANYWATSETVTNKIEASTATALYFSQISDNIYSIGRQDNLVPITVLGSREVLMQSIREKSMRKARRLSK